MATARLQPQSIDSKLILITEYNLSKDYRRYPGTQMRVRRAIEKGREEDIPPIVVLQNPFNSAERTRTAYQKFKEMCREDGEFYRKAEEEVLEMTLFQNRLLCYNGNRRLEEFQKRQIPIKAFVITSQKEFEQIPKEEKRIPDERPKELPFEYDLEYGIDRNYILSYLHCLESFVSNQARIKHQEDFLTREGFSQK